MLLQELNRDEAKGFVKIVSEFEKVDNNISTEEEELLKRYLTKFDFSEEDVKNITLNDAKNILIAADDRIKKIVYFELVGVALIDGEYENSEVDFLEELSVKLGITRSDKIAFANYYYDFENIKQLTDEELRNKLKNIIK